MTRKLCMLLLAAFFLAPGAAFAQEEEAAQDGSQQPGESAAQAERSDQEPELEVAEEGNGGEVGLAQPVGEGEGDDEDPAGAVLEAVGGDPEGAEDATLPLAEVERPVEDSLPKAAGVTQVEGAALVAPSLPGSGGEADLVDGAPGVQTEAVVLGPWFDVSKVWMAVLGIFISIMVIFFIQYAKGGGKLFVRKIAGLDAVDEAIGRATEMGRPILFVPGIMDMDNVQTIAGLTILGKIAKTTAEYDTPLNVPVCRSIVMTTAREMVRESYMSVGRPDAFNPDTIHYLTDEQFGYVAGVDGIIVRDKPATCFYLGAFFAESLILAETGNAHGAIQIAGTAMPSQLPFFIAACDYTLIGEELFAASAYLSGEPKQLGSLKGQDVGKLVAMAAIAIGVVSATLAEVTGAGVFNSITQFIKSIFAA